MDAAGVKLFALRGRDGVLRGFHNVCRHRGARLLERTANAILCAARITIGCMRRTGHCCRFRSLARTPPLIGGDWPLQSAQLAEWRGLLFIAIDPG